MTGDRDDGDTTTFSKAWRANDERYVQMLNDAGGFHSRELPQKTGPFATAPLALRATSAPTAAAEAPRPAQPPSLSQDGRMLRPIVALPVGKAFRRAPVPPPPKVAWLPLDQLVVDDAYQRGLGGASLTLIRKLAAKWDWSRFKPLSVAPTSNGRYEVIDGQHSAIAAATHGAIELLPCLVLNASTMAEKSSAFVGINHDRLRLTPYALFRARVAAGDDPLVEAVQRALASSGARLVESVHAGQTYPVGTVPCVSKLLTIARKHGGEVLSRALQIAVDGEVNVVSSTVISGVVGCLLRADAPEDAVLARGLKRLGGGKLTTQADLTWRTGAAPNISVAAERVLMTASGSR